MKALQLFSDEYVQQCRGLTPDQVVGFLDDFRRLHGKRPARSKLISMKVPEDLLNTFKAKAKMINMPYQTQIKALMKEWVLDPRDSCRK